MELPPEVTPVQQHAKAFEDAETLEQLKAAVIAANGDKRLGEADKARLAVLKDERKKALAELQPGGALFATPQDPNAAK